MAKVKDLSAGQTQIHRWFVIEMQKSITDKKPETILLCVK